MSTDEKTVPANAGCERCGTDDRAPGAKYCQACIEASYLVYVDGDVETGYIHDTPQDAHDEAFLVAESALEGTVEVRGPNGYRKVVALPSRRQEGTISRLLGRVRRFRPASARGPQTVRERTASELERAECPALAEGVRDGLGTEEILSRLRAIDESEGDGAEIVAANQLPPADERSVDARTVVLDSAHRDAIRLAAEVLEEHAGDGGDPERLTEAASQLDAILAGWDAAGRGRPAVVQAGDRLVIAVLFELPADWTAPSAFEGFVRRLYDAKIHEEALFCSPPLIATQRQLADSSFSVDVVYHGTHTRRVLTPAEEGSR